MADKLINFKKVVNGNGLYQLIYQFIEIAFIEYINIEGDNIKELKEESNNELQQLKLLNEFIKQYIEDYKDQSCEIIQPTLDNGSLEFLDNQVKLEKKLDKSIETTNKNTRDSLKGIIKNFLELNFYYISQRYLLYKLIHDFSEPFSEQLEKKINEIVEKSLKKNKVLEFIKKSYNIIFKDFIESNFKKFKNGKIYEEKDDKNVNNKYSYVKKNYNVSTNHIKEKNLDCPYPSFKNY